MLQFLNKILAIIIAFIVIFSSLSFTVEKHICMDEVTDISFFTEADSCGMQGDECEQDTSEKTNSFNEKDCCNTVDELIPGNQIEQPAIDSFEIDQVQFIVTYTYTYLNLFEENKDVIPFTVYSSPPIVDKDILVLYQIFLI